MNPLNLVFLRAYAHPPPAELLKAVPEEWLRGRLHRVAQGSARPRRGEQREVSCALRLTRAGIQVFAARYQGRVYYAACRQEAPLLAVGAWGTELRLAATEVDCWPWSGTPLPSKGLWLGDEWGYQGPVLPERLDRYGFDAAEGMRAGAALWVARRRSRCKGGSGQGGPHPSAPGTRASRAPSTTHSPEGHLDVCQA